jgi:hypothetical protein
MDDKQFHRRARRAFIRTHHPDAGGEAAAFIDGLAALDDLANEPAARVVVVPDVHWLVRIVTALGRRAGWRRPPPRVK